MKIPQSHFNRFKREFIRWQQLLGLTCYRICFEHKHLPGSFAEIDIDEEAQIAVVRLCAELSEPDTQHYLGPEYHAKHEAIHLLTHRLMWLAQERYATRDEISREWEALVRRLEKVLK